MVIIDIHQKANSVTICYRLKNDFRIYMQKLDVDLNLNLLNMGPCEILSTEVIPSTFHFISDCLCIMVHSSHDGRYSLSLWEKDLIDSTSSFFDSFQDTESGKWKVVHQHEFSSKVTSVRKRDLTVWIGLANGMVFELQVKPWDIKQGDSQSFPHLNFSLFVNELNCGPRTIDFGIKKEMDINDKSCSTGPVEYLIESSNELVVLGAHKEANGYKFSINHFLGDTSEKGSYV